MQKDMAVEKYVAKKLKLKLMDLDFLPYDTWVSESDVVEKRNIGTIVEFLKKHNTGEKRTPEEWDSLYDELF